MLVRLELPLAYSILKLSAVPLAMPAPHSSLPLPGRVHTEAPPGFTVHPCALRIPVAALTLYGYGSVFSKLVAYGLAGFAGTGP